MNARVEVEVILVETADEMEEILADRLNDRWILHGHMVVDGEGWFVQPILRVAYDHDGVSEMGSEMEH